MNENARLMGDTYKQAFGTDPARQRALSPTHHAAAPNAPAFLILHVQRRDGTAQSRALGDALRTAGTNVAVKGFAGRGLAGHMEINRRLGDPDYPATQVVDDWLTELFARSLPSGTVSPPFNRCGPIVNVAYRDSGCTYLLFSVDAVSFKKKN